MRVVLTILSGVVLAVALYQVLESWELFRSFRRVPSNPTTGAEALVGSQGEVVESFKRIGPERAVIGRVQIGSESWEAELIDGGGDLAQVGEHVSVVGASGSLLKVTRC